MSPQGMSRKRPAPGTSPAVHPQLGQLPNYNQAAGSSLSNDQFLQWGQNPSSNAPSLDTSSYNTGAILPQPHDIPSGALTSNQVARRPPTNQTVSRHRNYEQPSASIPEQANGPGESGWSESLEELYKRALVAKREAQAKRKQIPPFVQKLSRYFYLYAVFSNH